MDVTRHNWDEAAKSWMETCEGLKEECFRHKAEIERLRGRYEEQLAIAGTALANWEERNNLVEHLRTENERLLGEVRRLVGCDIREAIMQKQRDDARAVIDKDSTELERLRAGWRQAEQERDRLLRLFSELDEELDGVAVPKSAAAIVMALRRLREDTDD